MKILSKSSHQFKFLLVILVIILFFVPGFSLAYDDYNAWLYRNLAKDLVNQGSYHDAVQSYLIAQTFQPNLPIKDELTNAYALERSSLQFHRGLLKLRTARNHSDYKTAKNFFLAVISQDKNYQKAQEKIALCDQKIGIPPGSSSKTKQIMTSQKCTEEWNGFCLVGDEQWRTFIRKQLDYIPKISTARWETVKVHARRIEQVVPGPGASPVSYCGDTITARNVYNDGTPLSNWASVFEIVHEADHALPGMCSRSTHPQMAINWENVFYSQVYFYFKVPDGAALSNTDFTFSNGESVNFTGKVFEYATAMLVSVTDYSGKKVYSSGPLGTVNGEDFTFPLTFNYGSGIYQMSISGNAGGAHSSPSYWIQVN